MLAKSSHEECCSLYPCESECANHFRYLQCSVLFVFCFLYVAKWISDLFCSSQFCSTAESLKCLLKYLHSLPYNLCCLFCDEYEILVDAI